MSASPISDESALTVGYWRPVIYKRVFHMAVGSVMVLCSAAEWPRPLVQKVVNPLVYEVVGGVWLTAGFTLVVLFLTLSALIVVAMKTGILGGMAMSLARSISEGLLTMGIELILGTYGLCAGIVVMHGVVLMVTGSGGGLRVVVGSFMFLFIGASADALAIVYTRFTRVYEDDQNRLRWVVMSLLAAIGGTAWCWYSTQALLS